MKLACAQKRCADGDIAPLIQNVIWFASKMTCHLSFYCIVEQYCTFLYHMYGIAFLTQTDLTENNLKKKNCAKFSVHYLTNMQFQTTDLKIQ